MEATIVQPSPEEKRKRELASQLFGTGGLTGPSRAPRHKQRRGHPVKVDHEHPPKSGGHLNEMKAKHPETDLLLDLQVQCTCIYIHVRIQCSNCPVNRQLPACILSKFKLCRKIV